MTLTKSIFLMTRLKQIKLNMIKTEEQLKYLHYQVVNEKNMNI